MSEIDEIPEELLITNILLRLPIKSLLRVKSFNKRMHSIISSSYFANIHLEKSKSSNKTQHLLINHKTCFLSFDFESYGGDNWDCSPFTEEGDISESSAGLARVIDSKLHSPRSNVFVVGSCDGLVCLRTNFNFFYVWNPTTLVSRKVCFPGKQKNQDVVWGFNRVAKENDYRVVRICQNRLLNDEKIIQVYSLLKDTWTITQEVFQIRGERVILTGLGVSVNDATYSLYKAYKTVGRYISISWWIIGFDWVNEKLKTVPFPGWLGNGWDRIQPPLMYVMDGCLYACWKMNDSQVFEVGMFATGSWTKLYHISHKTHEHLVCAMHYYHQGMPNITNKSRFAINFPIRNPFAIDLNKNNEKRYTFLLIDPADDHFEDAHTLKIPSTRNVVMYIESLVSPFVASLDK